jgi:hypothetical protein
MPRIVTTHYRPKRARKRKAAALDVAVITSGKGRASNDNRANARRPSCRPSHARGSKGGGSGGWVVAPPQETQAGQAHPEQRQAGGFGDRGTTTRRNYEQTRAEQEDRASVVI